MNEYFFLDCTDCLKLRTENEVLKEQVREREEKLKMLLQQLSDNMTKARADRLALENANHRMKIKYAQSKVGSRSIHKGITEHLFITRISGPFGPKILALSGQGIDCSKAPDPLTLESLLFFLPVDR